MDPGPLKAHIVNYYKELFGAQVDVEPASLFADFQPRIDDARHDSLLAPATAAEVKRALFSMKGTKSPGPDDIHAIFYKENWEAISDSFVNFVNSALCDASFPAELAEAHMVLIPKKANPDLIQKFRPITLLNVAYKVLSKFRPDLIRPLLHELVVPFQSSFIPRRSTSDNIN